jgi:hypothetical protein
VAKVTAKDLSDRVADLAMERVAGLLADRVVGALMKAGFDKQFADALLRSFKEEVEERG